MSLALQQKHEENAMLREELETCRIVHARDIEELEGMMHPLVQLKAAEIDQTRDAHSRDIQALEEMLRPLAEELQQTRDAHSQDVQALQDMLRHLAEENMQLTQAMQDADILHQDVTRENLDDVLTRDLLTKQRSLDDSVQTIHTASTEILQEPQVEPSPNLDNRFDECYGTISQAMCPSPRMLFTRSPPVKNMVTRKDRTRLFSM